MGLELVLHGRTLHFSVYPPCARLRIELHYPVPGIRHHVSRVLLGPTREAWYIVPIVVQIRLESCCLQRRPRYLFDAPGDVPVEALSWLSHGYRRIEMRRPAGVVSELSG